MAEQTEISWADRTWSPWTGCAKISPGCDGCYAAHLMDTRMGRVQWGEPGAGEGTRDLMSAAYWRKPLAWDREAAKTGARPTVFPSLCDPFDTAVRMPWRWRLFDLIEATPHLTWLLLTKRVGNVLKLSDPERGERCLPRNAAIGATFVNQAEWDRDWPKLRDVQWRREPAFTFGSFEPLLGPIEFTEGWLPDWMIAGGESTQGAHEARPSHPAWFRAIRDAATAGGKAFHFKQWGEWIDHDQPGVDMLGTSRSPMHFWTPSHASVRIGKKAAGRLLDGRTHDSLPAKTGGR